MREIAFAVLVGSLGAGCMADSMLAERQATRARLRNEAWRIRERIARAEALHGRLEMAVRTGAEIGGAAGLARELRSSGFAIEKSAPGTLRLRLGGEASGLDAVAATRLARVATLLQERLPGHELSVEAAEIANAVAAVRVLHDEAGVPGPRLRAAVGSGPGIALEVRPTRAETLIEVQEVMTALSD
ncbi:MAG: hypothetical protein ACYTKD_12960 [Planctomycetota bacterium]|jgi:hypothetical protein